MNAQTVAIDPPGAGHHVVVSRALQPRRPRRRTLAGVAMAAGMGGVPHVMVTALACVIVVSAPLPFLLPSLCRPAARTSVRASARRALSLQRSRSASSSPKGAMGDWSAVYLHDTLGGSPRWPRRLQRHSLAMAVGALPRATALVQAVRLGSACCSLSSAPWRRPGSSARAPRRHARERRRRLRGSWASGSRTSSRSCSARPGACPGTARRGVGIAAVATTGATSGFLVGPPVIRIVADVTGLRVALGIVAGLCAYIARRRETPWTFAKGGTRRIARGKRDTGRAAIRNDMRARPTSGVGAGICVLAGFSAQTCCDYDFTGFSYDVSARSCCSRGGAAAGVGDARLSQRCDPRDREVASLGMRPRAPASLHRGRLPERRQLPRQATRALGPDGVQAARQPDEAWRWCFGFMSGASIVVAARVGDAAPRGAGDLGPRPRSRREPVLRSDSAGVLPPRTARRNSASDRCRPPVHTIMLTSFRAAPLALRRAVDAAAGRRPSTIRSLRLRPHRGAAGRRIRVALRVVPVVDDVLHAGRRRRPAGPPRRSRRRQNSQPVARRRSRDRRAARRRRRAAGRTTTPWSFGFARRMPREQRARGRRRRRPPSTSTRSRTRPRPRSPSSP